MFMAKYAARASPSAFGISPGGGDKSGVNLLTATVDVTRFA